MTLALKLYPIVLVTLALLDFVWLGNVMKDFYRANLGHLLAANPVWLPAALFYLMFAAGLLYFAVMPGIAASSWLRAALLGAALGFLAYGTYDLTNHATLKDWPLAVTLADMAWGTVASGIAAAAGYLAAKVFGG